MKRYSFKIQDSEFWYGCIVDHGIYYPFTKEQSYEVDLDPNRSNNQASPLLLSSKGRYIWCDSGFKLKIVNDEIEIYSSKFEPYIYEEGKNLREAYLCASRRFFPPNGVVPPKDFFIKPQYNTWIELLYNQNQKDILDYANNIIKHNMPVGIIMIDDGWSDYYGRWKFNTEKFPNPKDMVEKLHELGFKVMLWSCPFITPDTLEFRYLREKGYLVRNKDGGVSIREWWNGYSAVLDMSNPGAIEWYHQQNKNIIDKYGIDGFKFDAGDAKFYRDDDLTYKKIDANEHSRLWSEIGKRYEYNEYRACFKNAGLNLVQRLADKNHSWENNGITSLVPNQLTQGILGYSYTCPDMIGGGEYENFLKNSNNLDEELFIRYAQCAALMPMMQFSAAPWRVLSEKNFEYCKDSAWLHVKYADYIQKLASHSSKTGEPIVRYMEYEFPNEGLETITDQFMLGNKYLVAPVIKKGVIKRTVILPKGEWRDINGVSISGPKIIEVDAPLNVLNIFEKIR